MNCNNVYHIVQYCNNHLLICIAITFDCNFITIVMSIWNLNAYITLVNYTDNIYFFRFYFVHEFNCYILLTIFFNKDRYLIQNGANISVTRLPRIKKKSFILLPGWVFCVTTVDNSVMIKVIQKSPFFWKICQSLWGDLW